MDALKTAAKFFGSQAKLAEALELHPMTVSCWKKRRRVPPKHAAEIQRLTGGAVRAADLCPEVFARMSA